MPSQSTLRWGLRHRGNGRRAPLVRSVVVLGRDAGCHVRFRHPSVSLRHCEISACGASLRIRDLESRNGTRVNGKLVAESPLFEGDIVRLGDVELVLFVSDRGDSDPAFVAAPIATDSSSETVFFQEWDPSDAAHGAAAPSGDDVDSTGAPWDEVHVILLDDERPRGGARSHQTEESGEPPSTESLPQWEHTNECASTPAESRGSARSAVESVAGRSRTLTALRALPAKYPARLLWGSLLVLAVLGVGALSTSRGDRRLEAESLAVLEWAAASEARLMEANADHDERERFGREVAARVKPLSDRLEKQASPKHRIAQELLFASRHCCRAFANGSTDDSGDSRERFHSHLSIAKSLMARSTSAPMPNR